MNFTVSEDVANLLVQAGIVYGISNNSKPIRIAQDGYGSFYAGTAERREYGDRTICFIDTSGLDYDQFINKVKGQLRMRGLMPESR